MHFNLRLSIYSFEYYKYDGFPFRAIHSLKLPLIEVASDLSPLHPLHINNDGPK